MGSQFWKNLQKNHFLLKELIKRDFKKKYKRTVLGIVWSMLSPLMMLGVISFVFSQFFGSRIKYYIPYVLAGQIVFSYYSESSRAGMISLMANASIFSKINVPKYLFILSRNISALINFVLTLLIFFVFVFGAGIKPNLDMLLIVFPVICLVIFNYGIGLILSALYVFFRDMEYLYGVVLQIIMYGSAIFYNAEFLHGPVHYVFYLNPIYIYIKIIRDTVIYQNIPSLEYWILGMIYASLALLFGHLIYRKYNYQFIYYI